MVIMNLMIIYRKTSLPDRPLRQYIPSVTQIRFGQSPFYISVAYPSLRLLIHRQRRSNVRWVIKKNESPRVMMVRQRWDVIALSFPKTAPKLWQSRWLFRIRNWYEIRGKYLKNPIICSLNLDPFLFSSSARIINSTVRIAHCQVTRNHHRELEYSSTHCIIV